MSGNNALVLGGGGVKVAYQAGVLAALPPDVTFTHVYASSSGIFNAALMSRGLDGPSIADQWRRTRPMRGISVNWLQLLRLFWGRSLLKNDRLVKNIVKGDWQVPLPLTRLENDKRTYAFFAYNFSRHAVVPFDLEEIDEPRFKACIALPRWFPPELIPVAPPHPTRDGSEPRVETWVDAVFASDTNASALARQPSPVDDVWVIWTVDISGHWSNGWRSNYFRMLEISAAAAYRSERQRLIDSGFVSAADAHRIVRHGGPRPDHVLFEIAGDVPVHYLFTFFRRQVQRAVNQGERDAKRYLKKFEALWRSP